TRTRCSGDQASIRAGACRPPRSACTAWGSAPAGVTHPDSASAWVMDTAAVCPDGAGDGTHLIVIRTPGTIPGTARGDTAPGDIIRSTTVTAWVTSTAFTTGFMPVNGGITTAWIRTAITARSIMVPAAAR